MTHVACDEKLRSVVRSSMHPCPGNWVTIGRAVVYYARAAQASSAEFKCRLCMHFPSVLTRVTAGTGIIVERLLPYFC